MNKLIQYSTKYSTPVLLFLTLFIILLNSITQLNYYSEYNKNKTKIVSLITDNQKLANDINIINTANYKPLKKINDELYKSYDKLKLSETSKQQLSLICSTSIYSL